MEYEIVSQKQEIELTTSSGDSDVTLVQASRCGQYVSFVTAGGECFVYHLKTVRKLKTKKLSEKKKTFRKNPVDTPKKLFGLSTGS